MERGNLTMDALAALKFSIERLQIPAAVCRDLGGDLEVLGANIPCAGLFGFPKAESMLSSKLGDLLPQLGVLDLNKWRDFDGVRRDGTFIPVALNLTGAGDEDECYILAVFYDRTSNVAEAKRREDERTREVTALTAAQRATQEALDEADAAREEAEAARADSEKLRVQADSARQEAEERLLKQQRLSGQMNLLRQVFIGTLVLVFMLGVLIVAQWVTSGSLEGLTMIKDILLVMTGILGSAMASMFDSRNRDGA